jgi:hypothetical protein
MLRRYATVSAKPVSRLRARGKSPLGLENVCLWRNYIHLLTMQTDTGGQFIQRQKVLALWRDGVSTISLTRAPAATCAGLRATNSSSIVMSRTW